MYIDVRTVARNNQHRQWTEMTTQPGWPDVESALGELDGSTSSLMTMGIGDGCMTIGGGRDNYVVCATFDSRHYQAAVDPAQHGEDRHIHINGRPRACAAKVLVNKVVALRAARAFAMDGRLEPTVLWEAC